MNRRKFVTTLGVVPFLARFADKILPADRPMDKVKLLIPAEEVEVAKATYGGELTQAKLEEWARLVFKQSAHGRRKMWCTECGYDISVVDCPCGTRSELERAMKKPFAESRRRSLEERLKRMT